MMKESKTTTKELRRGRPGRETQHSVSIAQVLHPLGCHGMRKLPTSSTMSTCARDKVKAPHERAHVCTPTRCTLSSFHSPVTPEATDCVKHWVRFPMRCAEVQCTVQRAPLHASGLSCRHTQARVPRAPRTGPIPIASHGSVRAWVKGNTK